MDDLRRWLEVRRPPPPPELRRKVLEALDGQPAGVGGATELLSHARRRLDAVRERPGRVRESAFDLLVADALITYACEAALESEEPETALRSLFVAGAAR